MRNDQRSRTGWQAEEEAMLFAEIENSRAEGRSLKAVFEAVAQKTGRRPNSIRNYYYARIKEKDLSSIALHAGAFVPFSEEEIRSLLRTVLSAQANGISVRACTMSMGGGDNRAMLRYQNKYRALLKNRPRLVMETVRELAAEGVDFDPYAARGFARRVRGMEREMAGGLKAVGGVDAEAFLAGLNTLIERANGGREAELAADCEGLRERLRKQESELIALQSRFNALLRLYRGLLSANRDFLRSGGAGGDCMRVLSSSVEAGERALTEYNA